MIAWFKTRKKLIAENDSLRNRLEQAQSAAVLQGGQLAHADLLADRIKTHIALGCPESYARLKRELINYDKLYRRKHET